MAISGYMFLRCCCHRNKTDVQCFVYEALGLKQSWFFCQRKMLHLHMTETLTSAFVSAFCAWCTFTPRHFFLWDEVIISNCFQLWKCDYILIQILVLNQEYHHHHLTPIESRIGKNNILKRNSSWDKNHKGIQNMALGVNCKL